MKKILCLFFTAFLITGCSFQASMLSHDLPDSTRVNGAMEETTGPTVPENPYGPLDFGYEGDYLACFSGEYLLGVDVSFWQADIDWQQVKDAGIDFAMIRLAWRGSEQGLIFEDEYARVNYERALAAGIRVGGYFFSQAITPEEAIEEAQFVLEIIEGWQLEMPIVFDWEYISSTARTANVDAQTLIDCTAAFCKTIKDAGYEPMVYFNKELSRNTRYLEALADYKFWLAMYDTTMLYPYKIDMWQYTCTGTVPGITGDVDLNLYFLYE